MDLHTICLTDKVALSAFYDNVPLQQEVKVHLPFFYLIYTFLKSFENVIFESGLVITNNAMEQINNEEPFLHSMKITLALNPPLTTIYSELHAV